MALYKSGAEIAPITPATPDWSLYLHKAKMHFGAQEHFLSAASQGCAVQLIALLHCLLWAQIFDLEIKRINECFSFWAVAAGLWGKQSCPAREGVVVLSPLSQSR